MQISPCLNLGASLGDLSEVSDLSGSNFGCVSKESLGGDDRGGPGVGGVAVGPSVGSDVASGLSVLGEVGSLGSSNLRGVSEVAVRADNGTSPGAVRVGTPATVGVGSPVVSAVGPWVVAGGGGSGAVPLNSVNCLGGSHLGGVEGNDGVGGVGHGGKSEDNL